MQAQDLIKRVAGYDEDLARDLQKFIGSRKLGLVYEESKPEYVRLWNKQVIVGDLVNTLPPRGVVEDLSNDNDEHDVIWRVIQIDGNIAHLLRVEDGTTCDISLDNVVPVARFDQSIYCGLCETGRVERGSDKPYHTIINGENFHALESLLFAYRGKVDCIYIDPPYNTGAKDWKYNNNYVGPDDRYRHSKWLTFMEDRLRIAKQLLNPANSVLICTIDEKEYLRLGEASSQCVGLL
ncbi:DNA methyltransferase [Bifidobacterium thermophilum]|uniref:DNA methyltransferase n=1 Tax=Bifidobacterium thermophilum TaxID=33905 RepID=A0A2N3QEA6_9BIFI|nr:DNA methyltransferase [Bifidobacterium thermophilum]PKU88416.1 DNA methyltransferase [Bifidobacterium thermophilum]